MIAPSALTLNLRRAELNDAHILLEWRNDPVTRANFINEDLVPWDVHIRWLADSLTNQNRRIFLGIDDMPVGTSRLDACVSHLEISYTIAPSRRGKGYGYLLVKETLKMASMPVQAIVKAANYASQKVLERNGFQLVEAEGGFLTFRHE